MNHTKTYKYFHRFCGAMACFFFCMLFTLTTAVIFRDVVIQPDYKTHAISRSGELSTPEVEFSAPSRFNIGNITLNDNLFTTEFSATITTNLSSGYQLFVNTGTTDQCLNHASLPDTPCNSLAAHHKINHLPDTVSTTNFPSNSWGISIEAPYDSWQPIPADGSPELIIKDVNTNEPSETIDLKIGLKGNLTLTAGVYTSQIVFTVIANEPPMPSIFSMSPDSGSPGTEITVDGENLDYLYEITLNGVPCDNLDVIDSNTATFDIPDLGPEPPEELEWGIFSIFGGGEILASPPPFTYFDDQRATFSFTIDTRMTDTLDTDPTHYDGIEDTFILPMGNAFNTWALDGIGGVTYDYNWSVNWGDGTVETLSGTTTEESGYGVPHTYPAPGEYQISITSYHPESPGWMDAFGFDAGLSGASAASNAHMFKSIDTPLTDMMRSDTRGGRFAYMFYNTRNAVEIPQNLFIYIDTSQTTDFTRMFFNTFRDFAFNSTTATIPGGLFDPIDTTNADITFQMFQNTFNYFGWNSTVGDIPYSLFQNINTYYATNTANMFASTFSDCMFKSQAATIPSSLFWSIYTTNSLNTRLMFYETFYRYGRESLAGTIPSNLFMSVNSTASRDTYYMFRGTFSNYAYMSSAATIPSGLFSGTSVTNATNTSNMFYDTFNSYGYNSSSGSIPSGLFSAVQLTSATTNTSNMFYNTFYRAFYNSSAATIPANLFNGINTAFSTNTSGMFAYTFYEYGYNSLDASVPNNLFSIVSLASGNNTFSNMFSRTFTNFAGAGRSISSSDIGTIFTGANFNSKITAANASSVFSYTFQNMSSLTGYAQTFINTYLGASLVPSARAYTFAGTNVTDLGTINTNWK